MKQLTREELKRIIGGFAMPPKVGDDCSYKWTDAQGHQHTTAGTCNEAQNGGIYCSNGVGACSAY